MTHPLNINNININGEVMKLRLTLGALADIEAAFGGDVAAMKTRFQNPRIADVLIMLHALLVGGGASLSFEALKASDIDIAEAAGAIARAFEVLGAEAGGESAPGKSSSGAV